MGNLISTTSMLNLSNMCKFSIIQRFTVAVIMAIAFLTISQGAEARDIRMMSYNIRNATGLDGKIDTRRIASVIDSVAPDVVAIQAIDDGDVVTKCS